MNFMKRILSFLLILMAFGSSAQTFNVIVDLTQPNFSVQSPTNRTVWWQRSSPFPGNRQVFTTDGTVGTNLIPNQPVGLYYLTVIDTGQGNNLTALINLPANSANPVEASSIIAANGTATFPSGQVAWAACVSDVRYQLATNGSTFTIITNIAQLAASNMVVTIAPSITNTVAQTNFVIGNFVANLNGYANGATVSNAPNVIGTNIQGVTGIFTNTLTLGTAQSVNTPTNNIDDVNYLALKNATNGVLMAVTNFITVVTNSQLPTMTNIAVQAASKTVNPNVVTNTQNGVQFGGFNGPGFTNNNMFISQYLYFLNNGGTQSTASGMGVASGTSLLYIFGQFTGNIGVMENQNARGYSAISVQDNNGYEHAANGFGNTNSGGLTQGVDFHETSYVSNGVFFAPFPDFLDIQTGPVLGGPNTQHGRLVQDSDGTTKIEMATNTLQRVPEPGDSNLLISVSAISPTITGYGMAGTNGVLNLASGSNNLIGIIISNGVPQFPYGVLFGNGTFQNQSGVTNVSPGTGITASVSGGILSISSTGASVATNIQGWQYFPITQSGILGATNSNSLPISGTATTNNIIINSFNSSIPVNTSISGSAIISANSSQIVGGLNAPQWNNVILGGSNNQFNAVNQFVTGIASAMNVIAGGNGNEIGNYIHDGNSVLGNLIAGGLDNIIWTEPVGAQGGPGASYNFIGAGASNSINGSFSSIPGGSLNEIDIQGTNSVAMGNFSRISNNAVFAWSDGSVGRFNSVTNNSFLIQSINGVGINTNQPGSNALQVVGIINGSGISQNGTNLYSLIANLANTNAGGVFLTNNQGSVNIGGSGHTNGVVFAGSEFDVGQSRLAVDSGLYLQVTNSGVAMANGTYATNFSTGWTNLNGAIITNLWGTTNYFLSTNGYVLYYTINSPITSPWNGAFVFGPPPNPSVQYKWHIPDAVLTGAIMATNLDARYGTLVQTSSNGVVKLVSSTSNTLAGLIVGPNPNVVTNTENPVQLGRIGMTNGVLSVSGSITNYGDYTQFGSGSDVLRIDSLNLYAQGVRSYDIGNGWLYNSDASVAVVSLHDSALQDSVNKHAVEWNNRMLTLQSSSPTLDWGNRILEGGAWNVGGLTNSDVYYGNGGGLTNTSATNLVGSSVSNYVAAVALNVLKTSAFTNVVLSGNTTNIGLMVLYSNTIVEDLNTNSILATGFGDPNVNGGSPFYGYTGGAFFSYTNAVNGLYITNNQVSYPGLWLMMTSSGGTAPGYTNSSLIGTGWVSVGAGAAPGGKTVYGRTPNTYVEATNGVATNLTLNNPILANAPNILTNYWQNYAEFDDGLTVNGGPVIATNFFSDGVGNAYIADVGNSFNYITTGTGNVSFDDSGPNNLGANSANFYQGESQGNTGGNNNVYLANVQNNTVSNDSEGLVFEAQAGNNTVFSGGGAVFTAGTSGVNGNVGTSPFFAGSGPMTFIGQGPMGSAYIGSSGITIGPGGLFDTFIDCIGGAYQGNNYSVFVGISSGGYTNLNSTLVAANVFDPGVFEDSSTNPGTAGQVLTSTGTGTKYVTLSATNLAYLTIQTNWGSQFYTNTYNSRINVYSDEVTTSAASGVTGFQLLYDPSGGHNWQTNCDGSMTAVSLSIVGMTGHERLSGPIVIGGVYQWTNVSTVGSAALVNGYISN